MNNKRATKRALLTSITALVMCVVMLAGTTFAWFTDTATTSVNKIQAGTLKVDIQDEKGTSLNGETLKWVQAKSEGGTEQVDGTKILWEPGCTYQLQPFRIVNEGNLALKYTVKISGIVGSADLLKAIDFKVAVAKGQLVSKTSGSAATFTDAVSLNNFEGTLAANNSTGLITITGTMKESAGNDYQGLAINGIAITVVATQDTVEYDSKNNTYDTESTYLNQDTDGAYLIGSAGELRYFAAVVNADRSAYGGQTIKLTSDIDLGGTEWTPIMIGGSSGSPIITFDGQGHTISNFKVTANEGERFSGLFGTANFTKITNLKVDKAIVTGYGHVGAIVGHGMVTTIEDCTVTNSNLTAKTWWDPAENGGKGNWNDGDKVGAIAGWLDEGGVNVTGCTVTGCTLKGYRDIGGLIGYLGNKDNTVTGNNVSSTTITCDKTHDYKGYGSNTGSYNLNAIIGRNDTSGTTSVENPNPTDVTINY